MPPKRGKKKTGKRKMPRGYRHAEEKFEEAEARRGSFALRFFLKNKEKARVIFLDSEPCTVMEHVIREGKNPRTGKPKYNNYTSPRTWGDDESDPLIDAGNRPATVFYYTVLDGRERKTQDGKKVRWEKKMLGLKAQAYDVVRRRAATIKKRSKGGKSLLYAVFTVTRGSSSREPSTGIDWEYIGHYSRKKILQMVRKYDADATTEGIDFDEVLAVLPEKELKSVAKRFERKIEDDADAEDEYDEDLDDDDDEPSDAIFDDDEEEDEDDEDGEDEEDSEDDEDDEDYLD